MAYGLSNGHEKMTSRDPRRCCEAVRSAILATAWLLVDIRALSRAWLSIRVPECQKILTMALAGLTQDAL